MTIYTTATDKGGTAKTTTTAVLSQAAAYKGNRVLAIDLDPQGNLSYCLAADARRPGSYDLLHGAPSSSVIQTTAQGVDVIPASLNLRTEESAAGSARRLSQALEPVKDKYDVCFIDTPATAGELQYNAMQAADSLIIVLEADGYCVQALYQIHDTAGQIMQSNPRLKYAGVLIAKWETNAANIEKYLRDQIKETATALHIPYLGEVRRQRAPIKEATAFQQSLYEYAPKCNPAADYMAIYERITR